jgi:hypothetical protein
MLGNSLLLKLVDVLILLSESQRAVKDNFLISVLGGDESQYFTEKCSFKRKS